MTLGVFYALITGTDSFWVLIQQPPSNTPMPATDIQAMWLISGMSWDQRIVNLLSRVQRLVRFEHRFESDPFPKQKANALDILPRHGIQCEKKESFHVSRDRHFPHQTRSRRCHGYEGARALTSVIAQNDDAWRSGAKALAYRSRLPRQRARFIDGYFNHPRLIKIKGFFLGCLRLMQIDGRFGKYLYLCRSYIILSGRAQIYRNAHISVFTVRARV